MESKTHLVNGSMFAKNEIALMRANVPDYHRGGDSSSNFSFGGAARIIFESFLDVIVH